MIEGIIEIGPHLADLLGGVFMMVFVIVVLVLLYKSGWFRL